MASKRKASFNTLETEYTTLSGKALRFAEALSSEVTTLLAGAKISLASPIESRVKSFSSILEKIERKQLKVNHVDELDDFIGLRIMLLFLRDVKTVKDVIEGRLSVLESEDTAERLAENQLGYASMHYIVEFPKAWLSVPSLTPYNAMRAELQVRTMAQHIWAASEHVLQYKSEESVPKSVRRAIYRVSALLETVDLEFERVLQQRNAYRESLTSSNVPKDEDELNVDLLENILDSEYPAENKVPNEGYSLLLQQLTELGIRTVGALRAVIGAHKDAALAAEKAMVDANRVTLEHGGQVQEVDRTERGLFYIHTGLLRVTLTKAFGKKASDMFLDHKVEEKRS